MTATVIRHASRRKFTQIDRRAVNRDDLSYRALGVLVWLLDKPDGWDGFNAEAMAAGAGREGRDAVRAALRELETAGYVVRSKVQTAGGQWVTETWIYEHPGDRDAGPSPETENQASVDPPGVESTGPWKTDSRSTRLSPSPSTERDTARARANDAPGAGDDSGEAADAARIARSLGVKPSAPGRTYLGGPPARLHFADDEERARVKRVLRGVRDDLGFAPAPGDTGPPPVEEWDPAAITDQEGSP